MSQIYSVFMLGVLVMALLAGCNVPLEGARKKIVFTPTFCGRDGCDFADAIGVGGKIDVRIARSDGVGLSSIDLESSNPAVFTVRRVAPGANGEPTWEIEGTGVGIAQLQARSGSGVVDFIQIQVQAVTGFTLSLSFQEGLPPPEGYDQYFQFAPGESGSLRVAPAVGEQMIMGRYIYDYRIFDVSRETENVDPRYVNPEFERYMTISPEALDQGRCSFTAPGVIEEGITYMAIFTSAFHGPSHSMRIGIAFLPFATTNGSASGHGVESTP